MPKLARYLNPVHSINIVLFAGFICNIFGGSWSNPTSSHVQVGYELRRAGNILFLLSNVGIIIIVLFMAYLSFSREQRRDPIIIQLFIVLPIMLVRIVHATSQSFLASPDQVIIVGYSLDCCWFQIYLLLRYLYCGV